MPEVNFAKAGFRHSDDGVTVKEYRKGVQQVSERCAEVARSLGYLESERPAPAAPVVPEPSPPVRSRTADDPPPGTVEIPGDWEDLSWPVKKSLASKVTPNPVRSKQDAHEAIEKALANGTAKLVPAPGGPTGEGSAPQS